jgi:hypothetical protein
VDHGAFAVGALSMIGLPPAAGFVSKWYMVSGAMAAGQWPAVAVIAASTLLNAGYFLPIVYRAFFRPLPRGRPAHPHGEAPLPMVLALCASPPPARWRCSSSPTCRSRWRATGERHHETRTLARRPENVKQALARLPRRAGADRGGRRLRRPASAFRDRVAGSASTPPTASSPAC